MCKLHTFSFQLLSLIRPEVLTVYASLEFLLDSDIRVPWQKTGIPGRISPLVRLRDMGGDFAESG